MNCSNQAPVALYTSQLSTVFAMNKTWAERFGEKSRLLPSCDIILCFKPQAEAVNLKSCHISKSVSAMLLTFVYLHLPVDRWDSISGTEESHVNHKDSIIPHTWRWFIISIDICHILMTKCVGPPLNLCSQAVTQIWWRDCNNGPSGHMNQQSQWQKCYHSPQSMGCSTLWNWNLGQSLIGLKQATEVSCRGFKASTAYSLGDRS